MKVCVSLSGGLELMFNKQKNITLEIAEEREVIIADIIEELRKKHMTDKEEMFVKDGTVRPGIIVLINDTDWELLDNEKCVVRNGDEVCFISTLHGG